MVSTDHLFDLRKAWFQLQFASAFAAPYINICLKLLVLTALENVSWKIRDFVLCFFLILKERKHLTKLMGSYKSVLHISCSGNLGRTKTIVASKFRGLNVYLINFVSEVLIMKVRVKKNFFNRNLQGDALPKCWIFRKIIFQILSNIYHLYNFRQ